MAYLSNIQRGRRPVSARRVSFLDVLALYRQRRALARLDDDALDDLGITREEADAESRRPFWDFPTK